MQLPEQISALIDDELDEHSGSLFLQLGRDPDAAARWRRYHAIGEVLRNEELNLADNSFATRVAAALENEPHLLVPIAARNRITKPRWGYALAASMAGVAAFGLSSLKNVQGPAHSSFNSGISSANVIAAPPIMPVSVTALPEGEYLRRLHAYYLKFNEERRARIEPQNPIDYDVHLISIESNTR